MRVLRVVILALLFVVVVASHTLAYPIEPALRGKRHFFSQDQIELYSLIDPENPHISLIISIFRSGVLKDQLGAVRITATKGEPTFLTTLKASDDVVGILFPYGRIARRYDEYRGLLIYVVWVYGENDGAAYDIAVVPHKKKPKEEK